MENFALHILKINLLVMLCVCSVLILTRFIKKRYSVYWKYYAWFLMCIFLLLPINFSGDSAPIKINIPDNKSEMTFYQNQTADSDAAASGENTNSIAKNKHQDDTQPVGMRVDIEVVLRWFVYVWGVGFMILAVGRMLLYFVSISALYRWCIPVKSRSTLALYDRIRIRKELNHAPQLMISSKVSSPLLAGVRKTCLYLPDTEYTEQELTLIFLHELTHYKRRDLWYKMMILIVTTVYWFNPLLYIMKREAEKDIEYICDSNVVSFCSSKEQIQYNRLLLKTATSQTYKHYLSASLNDNTTSFKQRISYMIKVGSLKRGIVPAGLVIIILLGVNALVGCGTLTGTVEAKQTPEFRQIAEIQRETEYQKKTEAVESDSQQETRFPSRIEEVQDVTDREPQTERKVKPSELESPESEAAGLKDSETHHEAPVDESESESTTDEMPETGNTEEETVYIEAETEEPEVEKQVDLYALTFFDSALLGGTNRSEYPPSTYEIKVDRVFSTNFEFTVIEVDHQTQKRAAIIQKNLAYFTDDGTTAVCKGKQYTLFFSFPNSHNTLPVVTEIKVSGFAPLEGKTYVYNRIPNYEFD